MKTKRIPLFTPFQSMEQGLEVMLPVIDRIKDDGIRAEMLVVYGCLIETHNERVREEQVGEKI